jgi:hypothetical protein
MEPSMKHIELRATLEELRAAADEAVAAVGMIEQLRAEGADVVEDEQILRHHLRMMGQALIALSGGLS